MNKNKTKAVKQINDLAELKTKTLYLPTADFAINFPDVFYDDEELNERYFVISSALLNIYTKFSAEDTQKGEISAELISLFSKIQTEGERTTIKTEDNNFDMYTLGKVNVIFDTKKRSYDLGADIEKEGIKRAITQAEYWSKNYPKDIFDNVALITNDKSISLYLTSEAIEKYNVTFLNTQLKNGYRHISSDTELYSHWILNQKISEEDFRKLLPNEPKLATHEYIIFGENAENNNSNIGYYNSDTGHIEKLSQRIHLCLPKNAEQAIAFDAVTKAFNNRDVSPFVCIVGPQGTGKTFVVANTIISTVAPIRAHVLRSDIPELPESDEPRVRPDGTESKRPKYNAKNSAAYIKGPKNKDESDDSTPSFDRVLIVLPDHGMGAKTETLPGDRMAKFAPKIAAIKELIAQAVYTIRKERNLNVTRSYADLEAEWIISKIEFVTMGELSSRSPVNALIIFDEAQFHTSAQLRLGIGRLGEGSMVLILADPYQITNRFGASGNPIFILMRHISGKKPFFAIVLKKAIRTGPKLIELAGIRI